MKKQVILTVGAPGSGKSTWATEQVRTNKQKTIVLNRDDLRAMLFGGKYKYTRANEMHVTNAMKGMLQNALDDAHTSTIIIADTNLNDSTRNVYRYMVDQTNKLGIHKTPVEYVEHPFDVSWVELEKRNLVRGDKAVPKPVLRMFYLKMQQYLGKHTQYVPDETKQKAVIFDLDGTLANNDHRRAFDYDKLGEDTPNQWVVDILKMYADKNYEIICVSGRNAGDKEDNLKYWHSTAEWLMKHKIPHSRLLMREWDDSRCDDIVKEEIFWNNIAPFNNVQVAVDDRDRVCEMWRRIGVNCLQCNFGEF